MTERPKRSRTAWIWITGLLASAIAGGLIGDHLDYDGGLYGGIAGICTFVCARLWFGSSTSQK